MGEKEGILEPKLMHNDLVGSATDVESDRLSGLPDDLIHKILSFIPIKDAIGTSVLSSRWRSIWTLMPFLNFENLNHGTRISKFISNVLSHRNNQTHVSSVNLLLGRTVTDNESVREVLNCAFSHNAQQLSVSRLPGRFVRRPFSLRLSIITSPTWDLPYLTSLHLQHIQLPNDNDGAGLFSKCTNLKNLSLRRCVLMKGTKVFKICLPRLSNLTLEYIVPEPDKELEEYINVVAPKLKNLTISWCTGKHVISAPKLASLVIEGSHPWQISTPGFPSLEKADLCMSYLSEADPHKIVCLLQQLRSAKLLMLSLGILQILFQHRKNLSSSMELIPHQACVFAKAKIVKVKIKRPIKVYLEIGAQENVTTSTEINNYEDFPNGIFPLVSREDMKIMGDMATTEAFVRHLGMLLKRCKANSTTNTNKAHLDEHGKPQEKKHGAWELQSNLEEMIAMVKQSELVASEICLMMVEFWSITCKTLQFIKWLQEKGSLFQCIEGLMNQLSASNRAVMQPYYSKLCENAAILMTDILGWMKTKKEMEQMNAHII